MEKHHRFQEIYEQHKDRIYRLCRVMVHDNTQTEDLFQEVWIRIWKGIDKFHSQSKIETWMYRIVVNTSINHNSKQKRHTDKIEYSTEIKDVSPEESNGFDQILEAISRLENSNKAIIGLYLEGYAYKEIGAILGMTTSNVGVRINRIKKELSSILNLKSK